MWPYFKEGWDFEYIPFSTPLVGNRLLPQSWEGSPNIDCIDKLLLLPSWGNFQHCTKCSIQEIMPWMQYVPTVGGNGYFHSRRNWILEKPISGHTARTQWNPVLRSPEPQDIFGYIEWLSGSDIGIQVNLEYSKLQEFGGGGIKLGDLLRPDPEKKRGSEIRILNKKEKPWPQNAKERPWACWGRVGTALTCLLA